MSRIGTNTVKTGTAGMLALMEFISRVPDNVRDLLLVVSAFIVADTITGIIAAGIIGEISSKSMTTKLLAKLVQYTLLMVLCAGAAVLAHNWTLVSVGLAGIVGIEFISMLENLTKLEKHGGVNLGPIRPLLEKIGRYLQVRDERDPRLPGDPRDEREPGDARDVRREDDKE